MNLDFKIKMITEAKGTPNVKIGHLTLAMLAALAILGLASPGHSQVPDHPVITEVFQDPAGNDASAGRLQSNLHQEFIEIYVPAVVPALNKDALNLTFYEIEGDDSSLGLGRANYRIDLPTLDLDPANGLTPGAIARPPSGVIVIGWVEYVGGDPPTDLAGTPGTRVALINGGITSATDFAFVAINGSQFGGTTNFPVPVAVSYLDPSFPLNPNSGLSYASSGEIEQGSAAYLLVNRDDPGYSEVCAFNAPGGCNSAAGLPSGTTLQTSCLLDAFATNDDNSFDPDVQPTPVAEGIDLDLVLPEFGAFSLLVPQIEERLHGNSRIFLDAAKTTEDSNSANDDPSVDWTAYRSVTNTGAIEPTPGSVAFSTSPAELQVGSDPAQVFDVLTNTRARTALTAANIGGNFAMTLTTTPGTIPNPARIDVAGASSSSAPIGQTPISPAIEVECFASTPPGHTDVILIQVDAAAAAPGDPDVVNPTISVSATFQAIDPQTGLDAAGMPFQATTLLAVQSIADAPGTTNDFLATSLGQHVKANLGSRVIDERGNGATLIDPATNLAEPIVITPLVASLPDLPADFIELAGPVGKPSLVQTVLASAEVQSGKTSYDDSFNVGQTLLQARRFSITETPTSGGGFVPSEAVYYADATGNIGAPNSGLSGVTTRRAFELALIDTNVGPTGFVETGATDDLGLIVEVGQTSPGSPVVPGEFVFLSFTGGLEGADVDTLDAPPHGGIMNVVYLDLEPLSAVLGVDTIKGLIIVDGSGSSEVDPIEVFTLLPEPNAALLQTAATLLLIAIQRRRKA